MQGRREVFFNFRRFYPLQFQESLSRLFLSAYDLTKIIDGKQLALLRVCFCENQLPDFNIKPGLGLYLLLQVVYLLVFSAFWDCIRFPGH
jgi:hypothetical protein